MDVFSRTFLAAAAEAGVAIPTVSRHLPVFRRCVDPDDSAVLLARCLRPNSAMAGEFVLLLTNRRLVVIRESRLLHRLSLHLNVNLRRLSNVTWTTERHQPAVELAATAVDGVRERFWMNLGDVDRVRQVESLSQRLFGRLSAPEPRPAAVAA
ncbi:hypothetical protein [Jidongwangia harbinensis]|uniref:hypothetical protein n=1 Tax=Jidongwangia harbinensis TaxID=2878561 RepID=UPI001CD9446D|nr:hypothetical protein [Jidongwangia harbinensis]MCA2212615.1 hypothetical protein [Jidongwangia harbinensis]